METLSFGLPRLANGNESCPICPPCLEVQKKKKKKKKNGLGRKSPKRRRRSNEIKDGGYCIHETVPLGAGESQNKMNDCIWGTTKKGSVAERQGVNQGGRWGR